MRDKIGPNHLCPCGSGTKYKKCCMSTVVASERHFTSDDSKWQQLRQLEGRVIDQHLMPYALDKLPEDIINLALEEFFPEDLPESLDKEMFFNQLFLPWFLFNWIPDDDFELSRFHPEKTLSQNYLCFYKSRLNSQEKLFIEAMNQSYYSYYSIQEVNLGQSLLVKDILLGTLHTIKEKMGTYQLKRGDVVLSRLLTFDDQSIFVGMAPVVIPSSYHNDLLDFRKWLIAENADEALTSEVLRDDFELELFDYFFGILEYLFNKPVPELRNTDGDLLLFTKSYFRLTIPPEEALKCLLPLTLEADPDDFLEMADKDESGQIKHLDIPWLATGNKFHKGWDNTVVGQIRMSPGQLTLETNSFERSEKGQALLRQYLGDALYFQKIDIETLEQKMASLPKAKVREADDESRKLLELPEVQEQLKALARSHWDSWFDEPIAMLHNKSPSEAAQTREGREELEGLLLHYERQDIANPDNPFKVDMNYLRKKLCLDM